MIINKSTINSLPPSLSKDEQAKYIDLFYNHKDQNARDKLIIHNLRLVVFCITRYFANLDADFDDIFSVGSYGLQKAIDAFKPEKGQLSSFLVICIKNEINMYLRDSKNENKSISIYTPINKSSSNDDDLELVDTLADNESFEERSVQNLYVKEMMKKLAPHIETLPIMKRQIIELAFGLNGKEKTSQVKISLQLDISQTQVCRIIHDCLKKFADILNGKEPKTKKKAANKPSLTAKLFERYFQIPYTKENLAFFNKFLESVEERNKNAIESFFGINGKKRLSQTEIAKQLGLQHSAVCNFINRNIDKFNAIIDGTVPMPNPKSKAKLSGEEVLLSQYFDKPFNPKNKQLIEEFLGKLDEKNRFIFESAFGLNGQQALAKSDIAATLKVSTSHIYVLVNKNIKSLAAFLNGLEYIPDGQQSGEEVLFKKYLDRDMTAENLKIVSEFASYLDEKQRYIFESYFGLNGKERISQVAISEQIGLSKNRTSTIIHLTTERLAKVLDGLEPIKPPQKIYKKDLIKKLTGEELLFEKFLKKENNEENKQILYQYINTLNDKKRIIFESYFGLNGREKLSQPQLAEAMNTVQTNVSRIVLSCCQKIASIIDGEISMPVQKVKKQPEQISPEKELLEKHLGKPYDENSKQTLSDFLNDLKKKYKYIFESNFGLNGRERKKQVQIADELGVTRACISLIIGKCTEKLMRRFEETNEQSFFKKHIDQPYSEENLARVNTYLDTLPSKERKIFVHYFGLNGAKKCSVNELVELKYSSGTIYRIIKMIIKEINEELSQPATTSDDK